MNQSWAGSSRAEEQLLLFDLARQPYALPVTSVREVLPMATLIQIPEAPAELAGILRLRGSHLPVIDIRQRLGLAPSAPDLGHCIIIALTGTASVGLLVDAVRGLLGAAGLSEPAADPPKGRLIRRAIETDEGVVLLLEVDAVLGKELRAFLSQLLPGQAENSPAAAHLLEAARATRTGSAQ